MKLHPLMAWKKKAEGARLDVKTKLESSLDLQADQFDEDEAEEEDEEEEKEVTREAGSFSNYRSGKMLFARYWQNSFAQ